jgi:hypothetical protein
MLFTWPPQHLHRQENLWLLKNSHYHQQLPKDTNNPNQILIKKFLTKFKPKFIFIEFISRNFSSANSWRSLKNCAVSINRIWRLLILKLKPSNSISILLDVQIISCIICLSPSVLDGTARCLEENETLRQVKCKVTRPTTENNPHLSAGAIFHPCQPSARARKRYKPAKARSMPLSRFISAL